MIIARLKRSASAVRENLKLQLLTSVLLCFVIALGAFLIFHFSIRAFLLRSGDRNVAEARLIELAQDFQSLVSENGLTSADLDAIERLASENRVSVFVENRGVAEGVTFGAGPDGPVLSLSVAVRYSDGYSVTRFVYTPLRSLRFISWVISLLLAFDVFLTALYFMLKNKLNYVLKIERGIGILESGSLAHEIPVEGNDELARLASSVNLLSRSIRERIDSEQKAIQANRQIIGDLSHDIRTPLTVGMGYLTLLLEKNDLSEQERREYLSLALKKAEQIKERTRALLEFATLTSGQLPVNKTIVDVRTITEQLKMELSAFGELNAEDLIPAGTAINGDVGLLERLFDNLLSNLRKYGDQNEQVSFRALLDDGHIKNVQIEIKNTIKNAIKSSLEVKNESSFSLGLKICACILELHGGRFETFADENENTFRVRIFLPVHE